MINNTIKNIIFVINIAGLFSFIYILYSVITLNLLLIFQLILEYPQIKDILLFTKEHYKLYLLIKCLLLIILYLIMLMLTLGKLEIMMFLISLILLAILGIFFWAVINRLPLYETLPSLTILYESPICVYKLYYLQKGIINKIINEYAEIYENPINKMIFVEILRICLHWEEFRYLDKLQIKIFVDKIFRLYELRANGDIRYGILLLFANKYFYILLYTYILYLQ